MALSDRSNSIWPNDIIITWHSWLVFSCISSQWAHCSIFKYLAFVCCRSSQLTSETLHLPQLHLYRSATGWFTYAMGVIHMCYMCSSSISYMLTAACCGCSKSQYLLCHSSRSIPPRPNTLTLSCTLPCNPSKSCHDRNIKKSVCLWIHLVV